MNRTWFIALLLIFPFWSNAQNDLLFEHLTTQEGLSQSVVRTICQDREGFMWFGTHDGLNKYDGYSFTVFKPDLNDLRHTFHHNSITDIHEDRQGRLWVATLGSGLHLVDKRTGNVTAYEFKPNNSKVWDSSTRRWNTLYVIYEDGKGILWTASKGLTRFDPNTKKYTLYESPRFIDAITEDSSGRFWVGGIEGVNLFDRKKGTFTPVLIDSSLAHQPLITSLVLDATGMLWAGGLEGGLWQLDTRRNLLTFTRYNPGGIVNKGIRFNGLLADKAGFLWLATVAGLQRIDARSNQVTTYRADASRSGSLGSDLINSVYQDHSGVLWVGTNNGVNRAITQTKPFHSFQVSPSLPSVRLNTNFINALREDHTGDIWLASNADMFNGGFKNGLFRFESKQRQIKPVTVDAAEPASKDVLTIYEDRKHRLWVGTTQSLYQLNRTTGKFSHVPYPYSISHIVEDHSGKLWLPSGNNRGESAVLTAFDPDRGTFTEYPYNEKDTSGINNTFFYDILVSKRGDIYLATGGGGINRLDPKTGKVSHFLPDSQHPAGHISDKDVRCLYEDSQGIIWAGTGQGGLNRFDPRTGTFTHYTTREGLPSNSILSITGDASRNLWVGTNNGLSRFNPATHTFRNYSVEDGIPDNDFINSVVQSREGRLLFGTRNGFFFFYPDSIKDNTVPPPVYVTGLMVLEKQRPVPEKQLELSYQENFLTFEFVTLNYNTPQKNQYAFQLVGLDPTWIYSGNRRSARYTDLSPGTYTFRVKAANNDGVWNEKGSSILVIIHPPWWQTTWFRLLLSVCLLLIGVVSIRFYTQTKLRRQHDEMKRMLQAQEEERQRLAADLHDDLGATLSVIKGQLQMSHQSSDGLKAPIHLMEKAIVDLRHISHHLMPPEFVRLGLIESIREIVRRAEAGSDIYFLFITHGDERRLENEIELTIYRIAVELINNAMKHAKARHITIQLIFYPKQVSLLVEDDGRGYPMSVQNEQSGIGLRNIRSRVAYLKSKLQIDSGEKGTTAILEIPL